MGDNFASARTWARRGAIPAGAGLALTYAYATARYRREAQAGYDLRDPPPPGSCEFTRLVEA